MTVNIFVCVVYKLISDIFLGPDSQAISKSIIMIKISSIEEVEKNPKR